MLIDGLHNLLAGQRTFGAFSSTGGALTLSSLRNELRYIWQLYLPHLPGTTHYFAGLSTWREVWFHRSVGFYGWMDTMFPGRADNIALALATPVALLCARELVRRRHQLRRPPTRASAPTSQSARRARDDRRRLLRGRRAARRQALHALPYGQPTVTATLTRCFKTITSGQHPDPSSPNP